jgi:cytochrome c-type biogenesis protein CcmH
MNTILFWCLAAGMTLIALAFVLLPLLRSRSMSEVSRRDINIALYRERVQEIEQSLSSHDITPEDGAAVKVDLDARLLAEAGPLITSASARASVRSRRLMGLALLLLIPALSLVTYWHNSDWQLALAGNSPEAVSILLQRMEQHLEQQPDDIEGWRLLATSKAGVRQYDEAAQAYKRLNALAPSAESLVGEAEVRALSNGGNLQGQPDALIAQALRLEPQHPRALWYSGLVLLQRGQDSEALRHWNQLAKQELPDDFRQVLVRQIVAAGGKLPVAVKAVEIKVMVQLEPRFADQVTADMPLFVYARAMGQGGPPLVAVRRLVSELPLTITLDDSQSMLPNRKLSSADRWTITARIARQGSAETRSGDLAAEATVSRNQIQNPVRLVIDRALP